MLRFLLVSIPLVFLVITGIFCYRNPGMVIIDWLEYKIYTTVGFSFLIMMFGSFLIYLVVGIMCNIKGMLYNIKNLLLWCFHIRQNKVLTPQEIIAFSSSCDPSKLNKLARQYSNHWICDYLHYKSALLQDNQEDAQQAFENSNHQTNSQLQELVCYENIHYYLRKKDFANVQQELDKLDDKLAWVKELDETSPSSNE